MTNRLLMRFKVLTAVSMKMAVFWDVAPCSLVEVHRHFRGPCCLHNERDAPLKLRSPSTGLHGEISQKAVIFILTAVST
jgi:hypothetical protein